MKLLRRHALRIALASSVLGAVATLAIAGSAALQYYRILHALRLDPLQLEVYARARPAELAPGQRRVVIYGDSRSEGWPAPEGLSDIQWVNRGIGHQTTAQALGRFDADVAELRPDVIVLQLGVNDLKTIPLFPDREREIVARARRNLAALVTRAQSLGGEVIVVTIFPIGSIALWRRPFWSDRVQAAADALNAELATRVGPRLRLLPADSILRGAGRRLRPEYARDHLHLTPAGYRALNAKGLVPLLRASSH